MNINFKKNYALIHGLYLRIVMTKYFVMRNLRGTCLSIEMLQAWLHGKKKIGNPCSIV